MRDAGQPQRTRREAVRAFAVWWIVGFALWLLLEDLATLPECIDGAVAATLGAAAVTAAGTVLAPLRLPRGRLRHAWRPLGSLFADLPMLVAVLGGALLAGRRDPGGLREVAFAPAADPAERGGQAALAAIAGSLAPGTVVVALDAERGTLLVHELRPGTGRRAADPLELG